MRTDHISTLRGSESPIGVSRFSLFLSYDRFLPVSVSFVRSSNTILSCYDVFYGSSSMSAEQLASRCLRARLLLRDPDRYRTCVFSCRTHEIVCSLLRFGNLLWFPPACPPPGFLPGDAARGETHRRPPPPNSATSTPSAPRVPSISSWWDWRCSGCVVAVAFVPPTAPPTGCPGRLRPAFSRGCAVPRFRRMRALRHRCLVHRKALLFSPPVPTAGRHS